jgi:hypothetical protein
VFFYTPKKTPPQLKIAKNFWLFIGFTTGCSVNSASLFAGCHDTHGDKRIAENCPFSENLRYAGRWRLKFTLSPAPRGTGSPREKKDSFLPDSLTERERVKRRDATRRPLATAKPEARLTGSTATVLTLATMPIAVRWIPLAARFAGPTASDFWVMIDL